MLRVRTLFLSSLLLLLAGCPAFIQVPAGALATPGVTIEARDGSFVIQEGEPFATPFWVGAEQLACGPYGRDLNGSDYRDALDSGARRVLVHHPGRARPLHGVLMFCTVWDGNAPELTRWYRVHIPDRATEGLEDGVGLVFARATYVNSDGYPGQVAWALWLSEQEI